MKLVKITVAILVAISVLTLLSYQQGLAYTLEESFQQTVPRKEATLLEVNNLNGNIQVSSWAVDSVKIEALKKVTAPDREKAAEWLGKLEIQVMRQDKEISVETVYPRCSCPSRCLFDLLRGKRVRWSVDYTISVPANFSLQLHSTNGSITASGVEGEVEARSTNGSIRITEVEGSVLGQTTNGSVEIRNVQGDAVVRSTNGAVELWDIAGWVRCSTANGNVRAEITRTKLEKPCNLSTTNGSISVSLPPEISADIDARTTNGKIRFRLPVTVQGELGKRRLRGRIGQGGPLLRLRTINGDVIVEKALSKEGKVELPSIPEEKEKSASRREPWEWESAHLREFYLWPGDEDGWQWEPTGRFNRVEGLALGLKLTAHPTTSDQAKVYLQGNYGFARKRWTYKFGGKKSLKKKFSLEADIYDLVATQDEWLISDKEATCLILLAGIAARDYFRQQGYAICLGWQAGKFGYLKVGYSSDRYESLPKRTDWSLVNWRKPKRWNPPVAEGKINSVKISLCTEQSAGQFLRAEGEIAGGGLGGDFQFRRLQVETLRHTSLANKQFLDTRVKIGFADNQLPLQRKFQLGGIGTLRGYDYKEFQGDGMVLIQSEYWLKKGDKALVPFVDAGCTWPHNQTVKLQSLRFDGGVGLVWGGIRLNLAVAPPREPRWLLRFHKSL